MTDMIMGLQGLLENTFDAELLREMIGFAAERLGGRPRRCGLRREERRAQGATQWIS